MIENRRKISDTKLDKLEKGLINIQSDLLEIKESQKRLEIHNSFIVKIYFKFRDPLINLYDKLSKIIFLEKDNTRITL